MSTVFNHVRTFLEQQPIIARSLEKSSSPNILFSQLPKHWRSNKSFQDQFVVLILTPVPDNTEVSIWAGNDEAPCGEIRNEKAKVHKQVAKFNDLRFVGRSGRGRKFHMTIVVHSTPMMVATVRNVIKVTVDGPREARIPKPCSNKRPSEPSYHLDMPSTSLLPPIVPTPLWHWPIPVPQILAAQPFFPMLPPTSCPAQFPVSLPLPSNILPSRRISSTETATSHTPVRQEPETEPNTLSSLLGSIDSPATSAGFQTPSQPVRQEQEHASLNTSTSASSPTSFLATPSTSDGNANVEISPNSPISISLTQSTPESVTRKRRRTESATSSNGSSPTIWRPF